MINREMVYDIIYALAARDGREERLFGHDSRLAHEAFASALVGEEFPELWFELPLLGDPWFDLHVLTVPGSVEEGRTYTSGAGGHGELFEWFAAHESAGARQLALSFDVSAHDIANPAAQLLVGTRDYDLVNGFLEAAGRADAIDSYQGFIRRMPKDWFACYTGVFPGRQGMNLRVECIPLPDTQLKYAQDPSLIARDLAQVGLTELPDTLVTRCQELAQTPFQFEFQFDVTPDGMAGSTIGASLRFAPHKGIEGQVPFDEDGAGERLMELVEGWGLADERWRLLANTTFSKRVTFRGEGLLIYNYPTFVKLRWRDGEPLDAKTYLKAGAERC